MDVVFVGSIVLMLIAVCAFAVGCERLGEKQ